MSCCIRCFDVFDLKQALKKSKWSIDSYRMAVATYRNAESKEQKREMERLIANFQAISFKLADMATKIEAAEMLLRKAADLKNAGKNCTKVAAMAKYYASEISVQISTDAVQIFGGYGYTKDFPVEKFYRDSKLCTIGEGTSEIQKMVIARELIKEL